MIRKFLNVEHARISYEVNLMLDGEKIENLKVNMASSDLEEKIQTIIRRDMITVLSTSEFIFTDNNTWDKTFESTLKTFLKNSHVTRDVYTHDYAWAIPSFEILNDIASYSNIIEIYAGTGYWAHLLRIMNVDISCFDNFESHFVKENYSKYHKVEHTDNINYNTNQNCTLFMSWIPYEDTDCIDYVRKLNPTHILLLGESQFGCTASAEFFEFIKTRYEMIKTLEYPTWPGVHDFYSVWKRK